MCSLTSMRGDFLDLSLKWSNSQEQRKCGDISVSLTTTSLTLHCVFCEFYSDTLENFLMHLKNQHLDVLPIETTLWTESETTINDLQIKQEELDINDTKLQLDIIYAQENLADPLMAEEEKLNGCSVKCELNESLHSDEQDDSNSQCNSDTEKPKPKHICRLIHYIYEHPTLWNTQLGVHYVRSERMSAIESITKQFLQEYPNLNIGNKYVLNKFHDLKNIYYNYNKRKRKPHKNHEKYYELLHFLKDHEKTKTLKNLCRVCNKNVVCLPRHMQNFHSGKETPQKCDICEEMLPSIQKLQKHIRVVHRRYDCEHCTRTPYTNPKSLRRHMESNHPEIELPPKHSPGGYIKERICELCGRQFKSQVNLRAHYKSVHLQLHPYACPDCPRTFKNRDKLRSHRNSAHLNNREYVCDVCSKAFFDRKTMVQHKRLHSDVMNYICRVCGKAFRQAPALHSHMKTHQ